MAELVLELPLKVTITNTSNSIKTFIPYQETYLVNIDAGNSVEIENISSVEAIYYLGQATNGLEVVSEEIPFGRCPSVIFDKLGGTYKDSVTVKLSCNDKDNKAIIYYTLDGTIPDDFSNVYDKKSNGLVINNTETVKAIAYEPLEYKQPSLIGTQIYTILKQHNLIISDGTNITTTVTRNSVQLNSNTKVYDNDTLVIQSVVANDYTITDFRINDDNYAPPVLTTINYIVNGENVSIITKAIETANLIQRNDVIKNINFNTSLLPHVDSDFEVGTTSDLINVNNNFKLSLYLAAQDGLQLVGAINGSEYILYNEADSGWKTNAITSYNAALASAEDSVVTITDTSTLQALYFYGWQTYAHK